MNEYTLHEQKSLGLSGPGSGRPMPAQPTASMEGSYGVEVPEWDGNFSDTWLILPVVICLSQRLSHACLSTSLNMVKPRMAHYISYGSLDR